MVSRFHHLHCDSTRTPEIVVVCREETFPIQGAAPLSPNSRAKQTELLGASLLPAKLLVSVTELDRLRGRQVHPLSVFCGRIGGRHP